MSDKRDKAYARCTACDRKHYPKWVDETKPCGTRLRGFEPLCWNCLEISNRTARTDFHLYGGTNGEGGRMRYEDDWHSEGEAMVKREQLEGVQEAYLEGRDSSLWSHNEYLEYGEGGMGDLSQVWAGSTLLDSYD